MVSFKVRVCSITINLIPGGRSRGIMSQHVHTKQGHIVYELTCLLVNFMYLGLLLKLATVAVVCTVSISSS